MGKLIFNKAFTDTIAIIAYTEATGGTTQEYNSGGKRYKSHTFTSNDDFIVTKVGNSDRNQVDYLIIAGGGSPVASSPRGAGGAGGYQTTVAPAPSDDVKPKVTVNKQPYGVVIGAGGSNSNGVNSSALGITSVGGGRGGVSNGPGLAGGSGGGASSSNAAHQGGLGTFGQGRNGGSVTFTGFAVGGGGGGAGQVGQNAVNTVTGGKGGNGLNNLLRTGSNEIRGGGGGGFGNSSLGQGGDGGGGTGSNGGVNTGGGGGVGAGAATRNGGSGIVVIRYEIEPSV